MGAYDDVMQEMSEQKNKREEYISKLETYRKEVCNLMEADMEHVLTYACGIADFCITVKKYRLFPIKVSKINHVAWSDGKNIYIKDPNGSYADIDNCRLRKLHKNERAEFMFDEYFYIFFDDSERQNEIFHTNDTIRMLKKGQTYYVKNGIKSVYDAVDKFVSMPPTERAKAWVRILVK